MKDGRADAAPGNRAELTAARAQAKFARERHRTSAKLERQRAKLEKLRAQLDELRDDYRLSGAGKQLDIRTLDVFSSVAEEVIAAGRTGMNYDRLYTLWQAVQAAPREIPVIEIGSFRGGSARFIGSAFQTRGQTPRLYVCDTFEGPAETDPTIDVARSDSRKFDTVSARATAEYLSDYPALEMVVGDIVQTSRQLPEQFYGMVHVDVNFYPATAFCLRFFAPRLADDALMVIDDYGHLTCPGVKQAADEFVAEFPKYQLWHLLTGQAILSRLAAPR